MKHSPFSSRTLRLLTLVCLGWLCASCATHRHLVLDPVGPPSATSPLDFVGTGFLKVYSATETREVGKFINYYPHTPYTIYSTNGQKFRWIENSVAFIDESPALVRLPAGAYTIEAKDDDYGRVVVPIVIKGGDTTIVYLEARKLPSGEALSPTNAVRLPNGRLVGWRAQLHSGESRQ